MQQLKQTTRYAREVRAAADRGEYILAASLAVDLVPGSAAELNIS